MSAKKSGRRGKVPVCGGFIVTIIEIVIITYTGLFLIPANGTYGYPAQSWALVVPGGPWWLKNLSFFQENNAGHPGFHSHRAHDFLQFFLECSLAAKIKFDLTWLGEKKYVLRGNFYTEICWSNNTATYVEWSCRSQMQSSASRRR